MKRDEEPVKIMRGRLQTVYVDSLFGMTVHAYLYQKQGGYCALCGKDLPLRGGCVDHNHATGEVRGLLCPGCNTTLGMLENRRLHVWFESNAVQHYIKGNALAERGIQVDPP